MSKMFLFVHGCTLPRVIALFFRGRVVTCFAQESGCHELTTDGVVRGVVESSVLRWRVVNQLLLEVSACPFKIIHFNGTAFMIAMM
jgi:hypothetical protein